MRKHKKILFYISLVILTFLIAGHIEKNEVNAQIGAQQLACASGNNSPENIRIQISTAGTIPTGSKIISCRDGSDLSSPGAAVDGELRMTLSCPGDIGVVGGPIGGAGPAVPGGPVKLEAYCNDGPPPTLPRINITDASENTTTRTVNCAGDLSATFPINGIARGRIECSGGNITEATPGDYTVEVVCISNSIRTEGLGSSQVEFVCGGGIPAPIANIIITEVATTPGGGGGGTGPSGPCTDLSIGVKETGDSKVCDSGGQSRIIKYITQIARFLSAGVGVIVVIMIVVGGIQYVTSGGDPNGVAEAKSRIVNAIIALLLFIFAMAILNWLVPGGIV